jgi:DNA primase
MVRIHLRVIRKVAVAAMMMAALSGCSPIQPWVKPYERENLADVIMAFDRDPVATMHMDHVFEAREGARGATGTAGGGCGCN